jgi:Adenylate and Guanylate cyclase catalytic domain
VSDHQAMQVPGAHARIPRSPAGSGGNWLRGDSAASYNRLSASHPNSDAAERLGLAATGVGAGAGAGGRLASICSAITCRPGLRCPCGSRSRPGRPPSGEALTVTTANPSNPRRDFVVAYIDKGVTRSTSFTNNSNSGSGGTQPSRSRAGHRLLAAEQERSEQLLLNVLPAPIAARLKTGEKVIADRFSDVTVLFADFVDFTRGSERVDPAAVLKVLNELFSAFDELARHCGLEKMNVLRDIQVRRLRRTPTVEWQADAYRVSRARR